MRRRDARVCVRACVAEKKRGIERLFHIFRPTSRRPVARPLPFAVIFFRLRFGQQIPADRMPLAERGLSGPIYRVFSSL